MLKDLIKEKYLIGIVFFGVAARIFLYSQNPPSNSYDDHLEVISIYSNTIQKPTPNKCWECYQPPLYYSFAALFYKIALSTNLNNIAAWKVVQLLNCLLSILVLFIFLKILNVLGIKKLHQLLFLTFLAFLPRDIITSAMVGNDYLLIFSASISLLYYFKTLNSLKTDKKTTLKFFTFLSISVVIAALSKQHGLILMLFPAYILLILTFSKEFRSLLPYFILLFLLTIVVSLSDEFWKYYKTGIFLVSNQHFFDYAINQFPGAIENVEFFSFRFIKLIQTPFISESTSASLPTEIFARLFFDYEWRFLSPKIPPAVLMGRVAYLVGLGWIVFLATLVLKSLHTIKWKSLRNQIKYIVPCIVGFLYLLVPVVQTIRFPYFSSMKAMFILPGYFILLVMVAFLTKHIKISDRIIKTIVVINLIFAIILVLSMGIYIGITSNHLTGPLWAIPN